MIPIICPKCGGVDRRYLARNRRRLGVAVTWACCCDDVVVPCDHCGGGDGIAARYRATFTGVTPCDICIPTGFLHSRKPDFDINLAWTLIASEAGFPCLRRNDSSIGSPDAFAQWGRFYSESVDCTGAFSYQIDSLEIYLQFAAGIMVSVDVYLGGYDVFHGSDYWADCQSGGAINNTIGIGDCAASIIGYGGSVLIEAL